MLCTAFFVPVLLAAPFVRERGGASHLPASEQCERVIKLFRHQDVWGVSLYMFVFCAMPHPSSAMFFFNTDVLEFGPGFIAIVLVVGSVAEIGGLIIYHTWLNKKPFRPLFV